jgi:hypothetical protein
MTVTISCPTTWYIQCDWIRENCRHWSDLTEWALWQIGMDDIYFQLSDEDAIIFLLRWA